MKFMKAQNVKEKEKKKRKKVNKAFKKEKISEVFQDFEICFPFLMQTYAPAGTLPCACVQYTVTYSLN